MFILDLLIDLVTWVFWGNGAENYRYQNKLRNPSEYALNIHFLVFSTGVIFAYWLTAYITDTQIENCQAARIPDILHKSIVQDIVKRDDDQADT